VDNKTSIVVSSSSCSAENFNEVIIEGSTTPCRTVSKTTRPNFAKFSVLVVACDRGLARSSSDRHAIRYVLPVLWMASFFT